MIAFHLFQAPFKNLTLLKIKGKRILIFLVKSGVNSEQTDHTALIEISPT